MFLERNLQRVVTRVTNKFSSSWRFIKLIENLFLPCVDSSEEMERNRNKQKVSLKLNKIHLLKSLQFVGIFKKRYIRPLKVLGETFEIEELREFFYNRSYKVGFQNLNLI